MEKWTLSKFGDSLERRYYAEIAQKLPAYEIIWSNFIGNDGSNHLVEIPGFPEDEKVYRKNFSEHHYTVVESVLCLDQVIVNFEEVSAKGPQEHILDLQNLLMAFHGHMGRIYNNVEQLVYTFNRLTNTIKTDLPFEEISANPIVRGALASLSKYYYLRHIIVHGKKVPIGINQKGEVVIPTLRMEKNDSEGWDKNMDWNDVNEVVPIRKYFIDISLDLPIVVNSILHQISDALFRFTREKNLEMPKPGAITKKDFKSESTIMQSLTNTSRQNENAQTIQIISDKPSFNTSGSTDARH